jgi:tetratricopeptide (TPR) repeat protein
MLRKAAGWVPRSIKTVESLISERFPDAKLDHQEHELLSWVLGSLDVSEQARNLDERSRRGILLTVFERLLVQQLRRKPHLIMVVDDMHYSDEFSRDYLLTAPLPVGSVLMLSVPSADVLPVRIEAREFRLEAFTEEEVEQLTSAHFGESISPRRFVHELMAITEGNALHLVQLLSQVPADGGAAEALTRIIEENLAPDPLEAARERIRRLDEDSKKLILTASVIADTFPLPVLRRLIPPRSSLRNPLRTLQLKGLTQVRKKGGRAVFHFQHGIVREAASSLLGDIEKENLHAAIARTLRNYYGKRAERYLMSIARHYEMAGDRRQGLQAFLEAGPYLIRMGDLTSAREAFRGAERLADDNKGRTQALIGLINVAVAKGETEECQELARRFFDSSPSDLLQTRIYGHLARMHSAGGVLTRAAECAKKAIEIAQRCEAEAELGGACNRLAFALVSAGQMREAVKYARRGREIGEKLKDWTIRGNALNTLAAANMADGNIRKAKDLFERAGDAFEKSGLYGNVAVAKGNVATVMQYLGKYKDSFELQTEAVTMFEKMGAYGPAVIARYNAASALLALGAFDRVMSLLQETEPLLDKVKSPGVRGLGLIMKAQCLIKMGRVQEAMPVLEEAWEIRVNREKRLQGKIELTGAKVEAALLQGAPERALAETEALLNDTSEGESKSAYQQALLYRLHALVHAGKLPEAQHIARLVRDSDFTDENPTLQALSMARLSQFEAGMGNLAESESLLKKVAAAKCLDSESHAQALLTLGEAMMKGKHIEAAKKYLSIAGKIYSRLNKNGYRDCELKKVGELLGSLL